MNFHNTRLPEFIAIFAIGIPEFTTSCAITMSGREVRSSDNSNVRKRYILKNCSLSLEQLEQFNNFFLARAGRRFSFLLKDYLDFQVHRQPIPEVTARDSTRFQLQKIYNDEHAPYVKIITKPKLSTLKLWVGNAAIRFQDVNLNTGVVTVKNRLNQGQELIASFEFDVPVRFTHDHFSYTHNNDGTVALDNVEMIEVAE